MAFDLYLTTTVYIHDVSKCTNIHTMTAIWVIICTLQYNSIFPTNRLPTCAYTFYNNNIHTKVVLFFEGKYIHKIAIANQLHTANAH